MVGECIFCRPVFKRDSSGEIVPDSLFNNLYPSLLSIDYLYILFCMSLDPSTYSSTGSVTNRDID